jgi:hypothetical protein
MSARLFGIATLCLLTGCGLAAQQEQQAALQAQQAAGAAAAQQHLADVRLCQTSFSESNKDAVARARCFAIADEKLKPFQRNPDLTNLAIAKRNELAERQAAGKITRAQFVLELSQQTSWAMSEEQRRDNANQSVAAQQQAATAATIGAINAGAPRSCTRIGNTMNCY